MRSKEMIPVKISPGVSYHRFEDKVYVHNVKNQCDYIMGGVAGEILDYVAKNPTCSVPQLLKDFSTQYDENPEDVQREIGEFVDELLGEKIFTEVDKEIECDSSWSNTVP